MKSRVHLALALALAISSSGASEPKPFDRSDPVQMRPVKVIARPLEGFAISYAMRYLLWGPIDDVRFDDVDAGSEPAKRGIKSGDHVVSIDGVSVKGMKRKDFEQRFFRNSAPIIVEVQSPGAKESRKFEFQFEAGSWTK